MWAVAEMIDKAQECIFILDWWLTPELYLRRPPAYFPEWRLDRLLLKKAEQGVKIHVVVYKEVTQTMSMSSKHTKAHLENLHPNITCTRHPDHIGAKDSIQFWSHHEKVVCVDNRYAAIGGLDLCFGRWDTHNHPLADVHPTDFSKTLFPGQDYNNARVQDFKEVKDYVSNTLSIQDVPRMPWHDVHMTLEGPVVLDIAQHFVERWNEIKKRKYRDMDNIAWLALPHEPEYAPNEAASRHPHLEQWKEIGHKYKQKWHGSYREEDDDDRRQAGYQPSYEPEYNPERGQQTFSEGRRHGPGRAKSCRVQVVRSVCDWSHGVLTEHSIQDAYIQLIREAEHYIYIENQFFISNTQPKGSVTNQIAAALVERIVRAAREGKRFKVVVTIPEVPGFAGDVKTEGSIKTIMAAQYRTINRGGNSIYEEIRRAGYEPLDYIRFYHLRSYDRINAPNSFIEQMERNSGVRFHHAQIALARQWVAGDALTTQTEAEISLPQEETLVPSDKPPIIEKVPIPPTDDAARQVVEQFESGSRGLRSDDRVSDTVAQHMLADQTALESEIWLGTQEEELYAYVSELLYIHSKVMIVDDRRVIMGSANINDRSQKGDGDSEICLVVEDDDMIESYMNGQEWSASRFASTLRRQLYKEHLGLIPPQRCDSRQPDVTSFMRAAPYPNEDTTRSREDSLVADPLSDSTINLWNETARKNREIFGELFKPVPTNLVRSWADYENYKPKVKSGHLAPGVALDHAKSRLGQVRGALVESPLEFLIDDKALVSGPEWTVLNPTLPIYI
ncbi:phospholipase D [Crepidotus variabilis]|uniref:phospholipase D n=1 Tax=Crepidotus variabilis TaxID=179855 RepID=A0A9P6JSF8_9AGAR|nr:phospholipase D [Crepidotus variabilis]